jgi:hypothetical protein
MTLSPGASTRREVMNAFVQRVTAWIIQVPILYHLKPTFKIIFHPLSFLLQLFDMLFTVNIQCDKNCIPSNLHHLFLLAVCNERFVFRNKLECLSLARAGVK